ncbi:MAG: KH domain-containing protein [Verrucomicrobiae bacterium]|nr:KH domain-containing protein [Verrucomicrobiae bacterium]
METPPETSSPPAPADETPPPPPIDLPSFARESQTVLGDMLRLLEFQTKIDTIIEQDNIRIHLECDDPGRLIGRRGITVNQLQYILNRILQRKHPALPRIFLDVAGREEKEKEKAQTPAKPQAQTPPREKEKAPPKIEKSNNQLITRIKGLIAEVHRWGQPIDAGMLNPDDQKAVAEILTKEPEVEAVSMVSNAPAGKPQRFQFRLKHG